MRHDQAADARVRTRKKIVYVIGTYPNLTTTFIDREVLEAKRLGLDMTLVAIRGPESDSLEPAVREMMREITYLLPASILRVGAAHAGFLLRRPVTYLRTFVYLLTRDHPSTRSRFKTLLYFGGGVLAASLLRDRGVDHVHAHFADRAGVVAIVVSRLLAVPYSLSAHAVDIYRAPAFLREKIRSAKFTVTCTAFNKSYLEREIGRPVELIYHGLDFTSIRACAKPGVVQRPPLILAVGRLQEKKGLSYLLEACAGLRTRGIEFRCEIVGEGPCRERLQALVDDLDLESVVKLCGALPNAEVMSKYATASAFVLPCVVAQDGDRDGIPNVILEAMAFGLPVISTDVSGIPEAVRDHDTGLIVPPRSVPALTDAIAYVLERPEAAAALGRKAAEFVRREFDIRRNVERLIELLMA